MKLLYESTNWILMIKIECLIEYFMVFSERKENGI